MIKQKDLSEMQDHVRVMSKSEVPNAALLLKDLDLVVCEMARLRRWDKCHYLTENLYGELGDEVYRGKCATPGCLQKMAYTLLTDLEWGLYELQLMRNRD